MIFGLATGAAISGLLEKAIFTKYKVKTSESSIYYGWLICLFVSYIRSAYTLLGATTEGILINCIGLSVAALSVVIIYIATRWQYKRQPLPEDELLLADQLAE